MVFRCCLARKFLHWVSVPVICGCQTSMVGALPRTSFTIASAPNYCFFAMACAFFEVDYCSTVVGLQPMLIFVMRSSLVSWIMCYAMMAARLQALLCLVQHFHIGSLLLGFLGFLVCCRNDQVV